MAAADLNAAVTLPGEEYSRVALTPAAVELLRLLWARHGPLMCHQSGGCCDGSSPMCYPAGEFITAEADILLGQFDLSRSRRNPRLSSLGCPGSSSTTGATSI